MIASQDVQTHWDRWHAVTSVIQGGFETRPSGSRDDFRGTFQRFSMMGLNYCSIETNARGLYRGLELDNGERKDFCLVYQGRGRSVVRQARRMAVLDPGDMVLLSPYESAEFVNKGTIRQLSFRVDQASLTKAINGDTDLLCRAIHGESALGSLLSATLMQIHTRSRELKQSEGPGTSLDAAVASLLAVALSETGSGRDATEGNELISTMTVIRFIDTNLRNTNLSPAYIAAKLNCSARHIHRAFEGTGTTAASYIRETRLKACAEELRSPKFAHDSISDIAFRWGFSDISHFSRSFRSALGMSPRDYREAMLVAH